MSQKYKEATWKFLQEDYSAQQKPLPAQLFRDAPPQPATLNYLAQCYATALPPLHELDRFVADKEQEKIIGEVGCAVIVLRVADH